MRGAVPRKGYLGYGSAGYDGIERSGRFKFPKGNLGARCVEGLEKPE